MTPSDSDMELLDWLMWAVDLGDFGALSGLARELLASPTLWVDADPEPAPPVRGWL